MSASVDREEVARFDALGQSWWDEAGPMRVLHRFNPVRLAYIRDTVCRHFGRDPNAPLPLEGLSLVDIGCGGGVLSEPLARLGATVTGLDPAPNNIAVAKAHAEAEGIAVDYRSETIESVVAAGASFDIVVAMEVVEHVADVKGFIEAACRAVRPGGLLFAATINRTLRSFALAIVGAEYVLGWLPRGTHDWDKFVKPEELARSIEAGGLSLTDTSGVVFDPLRDRWRISGDTAVNYMVAAERLSA